jgi:hypothetical protein
LTPTGHRLTAKFRGVTVRQVNWTSENIDGPLQYDAIDSIRRGQITPLHIPVLWLCSDMM